MHKQEEFDLQAAILLPRIFNLEDHEFYYPVFSELGITYENKYGTHCEKDIKSINTFAFAWTFVTDNDDTYMKFKHRIDRCSGVRDKNDQFIYENDLVKDHAERVFKVYYNQHFLRWCLKPFNDKAIEDYRYGKGDYVDESLPLFDWAEIGSHGPDLTIVEI